ncbi:MAG: YdcF family protein [Eggerthellaceae bacterium]|nr:YdcF family protein [Eggerthellaceae bacterium]
MSWMNGGPSVVLVLAIAGIACLAYGISIMMLWSGTSFFAVWLALGVLLLGNAWAFHAGWWEMAPLVLRRAAAGIACAALAICVITQGLAISCFGSQGPDDLDYVVVLGAQVRNDGPSVVLQYRLDTAANYLQANPQTKCIVSGGKVFNDPEPEAQVMARYLIERGIDSARITIEDKSTNTVENIQNSMAFIDPDTDQVGIVTNNFHVFRGTAIARKQGIAHAYGIAAPSNWWYLPNNLLYETFGISKDFLKGNL